eukprot:SAG25_NODE_375_length_8919_cov_7.676644_2_plen_622_part_00
MWLPRESRLVSTIEFKFGETALTGSGANTNRYMALGKKAPVETTKGAPPGPNVALSAAPGHRLFDSARFVLNGVTVENTPSLADCASAQLLTKVDIAGPDTSGSGMLNSLRKDHGRLLGVSTTQEEYDTVDVDFEMAASRSAAEAATVDENLGGNFAAGLNVRDQVETLVKSRQSKLQSALPNPKCEILQMCYDPESGICKVEISEPLLLATHQHPYAIPSCDMQLFLGVSRTWQKDLLWCSDYSYGCLAGDGGIISPFPPTSEKLRMGQIYAEVTGIAYHAAYISPAVPAIPPSIGIKYSQITVQTKLLQSLSIQEQVICPPSCRAVLVAVRQRYHHICACNEELGRAGGGYNEIVTSLPSLDLADGQVDPRKQGRAMPHNLATIQNGTGDGWIVMDEFDPARRRTGDNIYVKGVPTVDMCTSAAERAKSYNKYSNDTAAADTLTFSGTGGAETVSTPKLADVEKEVTTHLESFQLQLGSAVAPKIPYSQLDPTKGQVTRMWHDFTAAAGRPLGMRAGCQSLSQYCGWDNPNGPSGPRNGNFGPIAFCRLLNPPNSLSNVLQIRGQLAPPIKYDGNTTSLQNDAQLELVVMCVADNLLTVEWDPQSGAEIPIKTATAPIV